MYHQIMLDIKSHYLQFMTVFFSPRIRLPIYFALCTLGFWLKDLHERETRNQDYPESLNPNVCDSNQFVLHYNNCSAVISIHFNNRVDKVNWLLKQDLKKLTF